MSGIGRIIIFEDDPVLMKEIAQMLSAHYDVQSYDRIGSFDPSFMPEDVLLYILDIMLPDGNGLDLCKIIRHNSKTPILLLTALDDERSIITGLECGADDYVTKPFSSKVLMARIRALIRRTMEERTSSIFCGELEIDFLNGRVCKRGVDIHLHAKELKIITRLVQAKGSLVSRDMLLEKIWDIDSCFINDNTLSVHMSRIRKKLGNYQGYSYIVTERGFGYRWGVKIEK